MFILYSASHSETLLAHLVNTLKNKPLKTVLAQECFLVPNQGMERWLSQQLAQEFGVFANYQFFLADAFFKHTAQKIAQTLNATEFESELLLWRIEGLLREIEEPVFSPLQHYLSGENSAVKRYQLATQLARLFQNYQLLRPDLLAAWQQGVILGVHSSENWQQALWQKITAQNGSNHQGILWQQAIETLTQSAKGQFKYQLPQRLFIFGVNQLPPLGLQFLQAVAKHCEVHFYWLNALPMNPNTATFHPLLASFGKQNIEFQKALSGFSHDCQSFEGLAVVTPTPTTLLQQLQYDLANTQTFQVLKTWKVYADNSISIHACHSRMREVEVLKNQLLQSLENNPALQLRDIVVTAPNIETYAPFITAVFADIPHYIAGRKDAKSCASTLETFIQFLQICGSRLGWQTVLDLLEQPTIYPNFDLSEADLERIKHWLSDTHVRWGKSAAHKQQLNLPPLSENTWQQSLERLLMGYAVGNDEYFVDHILPYKDLEGSSAQALGGLCDFIKLLFEASEALTLPKTLHDWSTPLYHYADLLFAQTNSNERQDLNDLLADFAEKLTAVHQQPVELTVIIDWLEQAVAEQKSASGLLRGSLTFCEMSAVRGIPFQIIAVLGMNDGDFPRTDKQPTFDLIAQQPRLGDPSRRAEDRQQFLELLLSARQQLIVTYVGQSLAQNQSIPPSVVISELLEVLSVDYQLHDIVVKQPLQPFSQNYFNGLDKNLFSYSQADYETAVALNRAKSASGIWWQGSIPPENNRLIELAELFAFYRHPQRYFLRRQLDLRLQTLQADLEEREPFAMESLESYTISQDWIQALLKGEDFNVAKLQAQGRWLSGVMGELEFIRQENEIIAFVSKINALKLGEKRPDQAIDLTYGDYRLIGKLGNLYENGSLFYRFAKLKGKDLLMALLQHSVINQIQPHCTYLLSVDELLVFSTELGNAELLSELLVMYLKGLQRPDTLFSDSVLDYVKQAHTLNNSNRANKPALQVAMDKLMLSLEQDYEPELQRLYGAVNDFSELLNDDFIDFCENIILPIWAATHRMEDI